MLGGGRGIDTLYSVACKLLGAHPAATISLVCCDVSAERISILAELAQLARQSRGRFRAVYVLDHPCGFLPALAGPLDVPWAMTMFGELEWHLDTDFYICGPAELAETGLRALHGLGTPAERIHSSFVQVDSP
jgi:ferredoxin-NADP reductase